MISNYTGSKNFLHHHRFFRKQWRDRWWWWWCQFCNLLFIIPWCLPRSGFDPRTRETPWKCCDWKERRLWSRPSSPLSKLLTRGESLYNGHKAGFRESLGCGKLSWEGSGKVSIALTTCSVLYWCELDDRIFESELKHRYNCLNFLITRTWSRHYDHYQDP